MADFHELLNKLRIEKVSHKKKLQPQSVLLKAHLRNMTVENVNRILKHSKK